MDDHRSDPPLLRAADLGLEYLSSLQERAVGRPIEPEALRAAWVATMANFAKIRDSIGTSPAAPIPFGSTPAIRRPRGAPGGVKR